MQRKKKFTATASLTRLLLEWFEVNARDLPWRRTHDPYAVWISEIMLQQTQVKTVIPYWERWMRALPTVEALAAAKPEKVLKLWEGLGYYSRARNAQKAAQMILENYGGVFPNEFEQVLELPGIGRYTAGAICSIAFNQPTAILDGNVARVASRVFGVEGHVKEKAANAQLWELAQGIVNCGSQVPDFKKRTEAAGVFAGNCSRVNQALMELGALVCLPREALCSACPLTGICFAHRSNRVKDFPQMAERIAATRRRFVAFVVEREGKFLVGQRPTGVVNGGLWEFPNIEVKPGGDGFAETSALFAVTDSKPLCRINHSITRYRILLEVFRAKASGKQPGKWKTLAQLKRLAFTAAHRRIVQKLG